MKIENLVKFVIVLTGNISKANRIVLFIYEKWAFGKTTKKRMSKEEKELYIFYPRFMGRKK